MDECSLPDNGDTIFVIELLNERIHFRCHLGIKAGNRFIQKQHFLRGAQGAGEQHPLLLTAHSAGRADASPTAKQLRNDAFQLALYNGHPGLRAHEYRSTIIENWMRGL